MLAAIFVAAQLHLLLCWYQLSRVWWAWPRPDGLWSIFWKDTVKPLPVICNRASGSHLSVIISFHVTRPDLIDFDKVGNISQYIVFCFQNIKVNNAILRRYWKWALFRPIFSPVYFTIYTFWLFVGFFHYSLIWGIMKNPSNMLNFLLLTKLFQGCSYCSVEKWISFVAPSFLCFNNCCFNVVSV